MAEIIQIQTYDFNSDDDSFTKEVEEENYQEMLMKNRPIKRQPLKNEYLEKCLSLILNISHKCGIIVENIFFQNIILALIIVNSIMMGLGTYDFVEKNEELNATFEEVDRVLLIIFTVELILNFLHKGYKLFFDGWLVFDAITIIMSWSFTNLQVFRSFRVFRAFRMVTRVKVLKRVIFALVDVLPSVSAIFGLLVLVVYIFTVMFTDLFRDLHPDFRSLPTTMFTLFQMMTLDWSETARDLHEELPWARLLIVVYVLLSGFIVYNLFIAVLCEAITSLRVEEEKEEEPKAWGLESPRLQDRIIELNACLEPIAKSQRNVDNFIIDLAKTMDNLEEMLSPEDEVSQVSKSSIISKSSIPSSPRPSGPVRFQSGKR